MAGVIEDGWYLTAQRCASPNCNQRPDPADISLLVIHNISLPPGQYGGGFIQQFFCNELDCDCHPYDYLERDILSQFKEACTWNINPVNAGWRVQEQSSELGIKANLVDPSIDLSNKTS